MDINTDANLPPIASKPCTLPLKHQLGSIGIERLRKGWKYLIKSSLLCFFNSYSSEEIPIRFSDTGSREAMYGLSKQNAHEPPVQRNKMSGMVSLVDSPKIDDMLPWLKASKNFMSLDMRSRCYDIKHSPEAREKSAFTTILGKNEFVRMHLDLHMV